MKLIIVDDEMLAIRNLQKKLLKIRPDYEIITFTEPAEALEYVSENTADIAFLDVEIGGTNRLLFVKKMKDFIPSLKIIFITAYERYAIEVFSLHASGYLLKPTSLQDIEKELNFDYPKPADENGRKARVKTFGGFELYVNGHPVSFMYSKAKELLACLVDRKGSAVMYREAVALLFDEISYNSAQKDYFKKIVQNMKNTLVQAGIGEILVKKHHSVSIIPEMLDCDCYRFLEGDIRAINAYQKDYMSGYSWAIFMPEAPFEHNTEEKVRELM